MFGYTVEIDHQQKIVRYSIKGYVEVDHLLNVMTRQGRLAEIKGSNWLCDFRQSKIVASDYDRYFSAADWEHPVAASECRPKIALLTDANNKKDDFGFFRSASFNSGRIVEFFDDEKSAQLWLRE